MGASYSHARACQVEPWALPCGSRRYARASCRALGTALRGMRRIVTLLATTLQALSPPPCALVVALNLASVASRILKPITIPLWRSASNRQLTRSQKRARWQSQGVQNRSSFFCYAATQLALQLHQERTQVVCSNREAQKRPARRYSRNSCHMFVFIVVCACSRECLLKG